MTEPSHQLSGPFGASRFGAYCELLCYRCGEPFSSDRPCWGDEPLLEAAGACLPFHVRLAAFALTLAVWVAVLSISTCGGGLPSPAFGHDAAAPVGEWRHE